MIWQICRKELLRNFRSFRFLSLFAVAVSLFAINPFLLSSKYDERLQEYNRNVEESRKRDKTYMIVAYRRPNPLLFAFEGGDQDAANAFNISLDGAPWAVMPRGADQYGMNLTFPDFQAVDWVFIFKFLFSLLAILLTFDTISGEKERGTLSLMCSNSVSRASIVVGKYLGALITVIIPAGVGMLISMIIVSLSGDAGLSVEFISRLGLVAVVAFVYFSLFVLIGIAVSSIVHRSSVSLLLLLSVWIMFVMVVPNLAGIIAEGMSGAVSEHELAKRERESYGEAILGWRKSVEEKGLKAQEELSEEFARFLNDQAEKRIKVMDSYISKIHTAEDLAVGISRLSPASAFEFASAEMVDAGVSSQRRFYEAARRYYDLYEDYMRQKTGKVQKYMHLVFPVKVEGNTVMVSTPPKERLPEDTSDFPALPEANLSLGESVATGLWNIGLLVVWNVALLLMSYLCFLKYDVR